MGNDGEVAAVTKDIPDVPAGFDLSDSSEQKHLSVKDRRRRFDPKSRHGGYGGKTTAKAQPLSWLTGDRSALLDVFLKIKRPKDDDGNIMITELDQQVPHLLAMAEDGSAGHLFDLPQLLETTCVSKSTTRDKNCPDVVMTTYLVKGVGWVSQGAEERQQLELRRQARLTLAVRCAKKGHRTVAMLRDAPLEKIGTTPSLIDKRSKFTCSAKAPTCNFQSARVFAEEVNNCWCAPEGDGSACKDYLEVDLGGACQVHFISTQGRFPPIAHTDKQTGMRIVHEGAPTYMNWVKSYELSYRAVSGHEWISLGDMKGNGDMTTEVAHDLRSLLPARKEIRYLRFRPLTYHRQPAMRIGVYGVRLGKSGKDAKGPIEAAEDMVTFKVGHVKEGANLRQVARGACGMDCVKCSKYSGMCTRFYGDDVGILGVRRKRFKEGVMEEVRQISVEAWSGLAPLPEDGDDARQHLFDEALAAEAAAGSEPATAAPVAAATFPPVRPQLLRTRSRSDPDFLSRTPSSSVGDGSFSSFVRVQGDSEDLADFDENKWVHVG